MNYSEEKKVFEKLKSESSTEAKTEYEVAIRELLKNYNTTIHENRFIVGGAVEVFTYCLLRCVGIDCALVGSQAQGGDIALRSGKKISIKGSFNGLTSVKLINQLGTGERNWTTATFFVISGVGILFGSPDIVPQEYVRFTQDGTEINKKGMKHLIDAYPQNVFKIDIAHKAPTKEANKSLKASTILAKQILSDTNARSLKKFANTE